MKWRVRLQVLLDGQSTAAGRRIALILYGLIILSAIVIAIETMPSLPEWARSALLFVEVFLVIVFSLEYAIRLYVARPWWRYAFSFWGLVDLVAILPAIILLAPDFASIRSLRLVRLLRLVKLFRADRALDRLWRAMMNIRAELSVFGFVALVVLYLSAVGIYHFERNAQPEIFSSIPASLWWSIATLSTVGYGDIYPVTTGGRVFTGFVLLVGIGLVAVPASLITTSLIHEIGQKNPTLSDTTETNKEIETNEA